MIENPEPSKWGKRKKSLDEQRERIMPGFGRVTSADRTPIPYERSVQETAEATFRQSPIGKIFTGFSFNENVERDPSYDVAEDLRPQDAPYISQFYFSPNREETQRLQSAIDARNADYMAIQARPFVSGMATFLDPSLLAIDAASYGLAHSVALPLLGSTLGATRLGVRAAEFGAQFPRLSRMAETAIAGAGGGALSIYAQEMAKGALDELHTNEELGEHVFIGALVGAALGGVVGAIGPLGKQRLTDEFVGAYRQGQRVAGPPPEFVGPIRPTAAEEGILSTGKRPEFRAELREAEGPPKPTREQIAERARAIREQATKGSEGERRNAYSDLRARFAIIGESLITGKNVPKPIKAAIRVVSKPIRSMSSTNRLLSSPFGAARLFAIGTARNAVEFLGTREGMVLPRSAQNRIEDIMNQAMDLNIDMFEHFMRANNIKPGVLSSEKLAIAKKIYEETKFYEDVGTHLLYIDTPRERFMTVNPHVRAAAKEAYDRIYKPFGDLLKEYKLIHPEAKTEEVLNYLNRVWKPSKILNDPEGFKNWLADFYALQNERLKQIMPNYEREIDFARTLKRDAKRFEGAAKKIEKLQKSIDKNFEEKVNKLLEEDEQFISKTEERFNAKRDNISKKYSELKAKEGVLPDFASTKKLLKDEVKTARKERDSLFKKFDEQITTLKLNAKEARAQRNEKIKDIESGKKDKFIKDEFLKQNPNIKTLIDFGVDTDVQSVDELFDSVLMKQLRKDLISDERLYTSIEIEEINAKIASIRKEKKLALTDNKYSLDKNIADASELLQEEARLAGKKGERPKLLEAREAIEQKAIDLEEAKVITEHKVKMAEKIAKVQEPVDRLEALQRKYSRAGLVAQAERKGAEAQAKIMRDIGAPEEQISAMLKEAKRRERLAIKEATPTTEALALAAELEEGAAMATKQAEELIPWELRSSTTGKPYSIWDPIEHPDHAYNLANKTFYTILGQEDEVVTNPILSALSGTQNAGMFKPRGIKMPDDYAGIENWVERDIRVLVNNFASGVSPPIALTELMQDLNKLDIVRQTVKRMQALDKNVSDRMLTELPDEMQHFTEIPKVLGTMMREEFRMMSEGLAGKELIDLEKKYKDAEKNLASLDKQIKGVFANSMNVNAQDASDFVDLFNAFASTTTTNNLAISIMADTMSSTLRFGLPKYIDGIMPIIFSKELRDLSKEELKALNISLKTAQGTVIKNRISGRESSLKNSAVGRGVMNLANRLGNITGANGVQSVAEISTVVLIKSNLLEMAKRAAEGTITQKEITYLAQRATSLEKAKKIHELWKRHGFSKGSTKGIDPSKIERFSPEDAEAFKYYSNFINDDLRTIIARPGVGSTPDFAYTPFGKSIMYLKKWFLAATNDLILPAAQRADKEALQGFLTLFALGALQSRVRALYRDEPERDFNLEGFIFDSLSNSGLPGLYTWGIDAGQAAGLISGLGGARYDPMNGLPSLIFGPGIIGYSDKTLNILGKLRKIATDEDRQFTYKDFNYMASSAIPLYRWGPVAAAVRPSAREYFESIGRGE